MQDFSDILENWYKSNGRYDLPWRNVTDPYLIWISEIILQQTRVAQGMDYYKRFIEHFPNVFSLAEASEDDVLKQWQGLGYYSRARNLHLSAKMVAERGTFPTTYEEIRQLKGIGEYTASAICSFAYHQNYAVVDGNVYRVLSRIFDIHTPIDSTAGKKEFNLLANELLDKRHPHIYNSAIMDFGAIQCTPKSPNCQECPFIDKCMAFQNKTIQDLPVKSKKTAVTNRYFVYVYIEDDEKILLRRRGAGDIWQGLYEPYLIEFDTPPEEKEVLNRIAKLTDDKSCIQIVAKGLKHVLTHRILWIDCYKLTTQKIPHFEGFIAINKEDRDSYATPKIVTTIFKSIDNE